MHFKTVKMVNSVLCIFYHKKRKAKGQGKEKQNKNKMVSQSGLSPQNRESFQNTIWCFYSPILKKLLGPTPGKQYRQAAPNSVPFYALSLWIQVGTVRRFILSSCGWSTDSRVPLQIPGPTAINHLNANRCFRFSRSKVEDT